MKRWHVVIEFSDWVDAETRPQAIDEAVKRIQAECHDQNSIFGALGIYVTASDEMRLRGTV